ncbi:MAG: hypothetical protein J7J20_04870 [Desulfurococcales archaeon]|nr:hypothetical protein [Desulfurococcales archaeon]
MRGKLLGKKMRKGVSDLVVILTLVAIAIPVALAVQGWLSSQTSRVASFSTVPNFEAILVSKSISVDTQVYVVKIRNLGTYNYSLKDLTAYGVLESGEVISASKTTIIASNTERSLEPGESITISVTFSSSSKIKSIVIELTNSVTNKVESVEVNVA